MFMWRTPLKFKCR